MKRLLTLAILTSMTVFAERAPRPAPELSIAIPKARPILLSQYRGKVTVLEFLFTTCSHCQHAAQLMSKLQTEYGPKGFQALGAAFNPMADMLVPDFVRDHKVNYPVGTVARDTVYSFLQDDPNTSIHVPQIVIIDRKGRIRHQSLPREDTITATEQFLRTNIEALLKESAGAAKTAAPVKKAVSKKASS